MNLFGFVANSTLGFIDTDGRYAKSTDRPDAAELVREIYGLPKPLPRPPLPPRPIPPIPVPPLPLPDTKPDQQPAPKPRTTPEDQQEYRDDTKRYHTICDMPVPSFSDPCERAKWLKNKESECARLRREHHLKWFGSIDQAHQAVIDMREKNAKTWEKWIKDNCEPKCPPPPKAPNQ